MRGARICTAMLALAWASGCAARQPPRPAVAVLEVRGADGGQWQERVAELAEAHHYQVIPAETYWVMATRLKARPLTASNVARVASAVGAAAVVHGRMTGAKRRRVVTIYVRAGDTGRVVEKHRVRLRRSNRARGEAALERRLLASLPEPADEPVAARPAARNRRAATERPVAKARPTAKTKPVAKARPVAKTKPAKANRTASARPGHDRQPAAAKAADGPPPAPVEYDNRGQAIDDEMPSSLK